MSESMIRKACMADVPSIHRLILQAAREAPVIPRSKVELYETLRDFYVFDEGAGVQGCCALHITWEDLAEIKSLAVDPVLRGRGVGRQLVEACIAEARSLLLPRIFALTAVVGFFEKLGFREVEKTELPHKIWGECVRCPKFPDCDETAMILRLAP